MAQSVDDGEFWLPPAFLTDDDLFTEKKQQKERVKGAEDLLALETDFTASTSLFSHDFPFGFRSFGVSSDLTSPVESVVSSTETESDEEEDLSRRLTRTTLDDDLFFSTKGRVLSGSPQSTLCGATGNGCGCRQGTNRPVLSQPPATLDLLFAAAGEVAKMKTNGGGGRGLLGGCPPSLREQSPVTVPLKNSDHCDGQNSYQQPSLSYHQLQASQFQQLRQQQMMKQQSSGIWKAADLYQKQQSPSLVHHHHNRGLSNPAWPSLQQAQQRGSGGAGSGMPAVILGNPAGGKRGCAGTGVFLPRRIGAPAEPRKKPAGSTTVLLPARVVQALELNLDKMAVQQAYRRRVGPGARLTFENDAMVARNGNGGLDFGSNEKQSWSSRSPPGMEVEAGLPQEWTY